MSVVAQRKTALGQLSQRIPPNHVPVLVLTMEAVAIPWDPSALDLPAEGGSAWISHPVCEGPTMRGYLIDALREYLAGLEAKETTDGPTT